MTREELRAGHVALWEWLAETGDEDKIEWPQWAWNGGPYRHAKNLCFACARTTGKWHDLRCDECPIRWAEKPEDPGFYPCLDDKSPYYMWTREESLSTRKRLAAKIATMWPEGA